MAKKKELLKLQFVCVSFPSSSMRDWLWASARRSISLSMSSRVTFGVPNRLSLPKNDLRSYACTTYAYTGIYTESVQYRIGQSTLCNESFKWMPIKGNFWSSSLALYLENLRLHKLSPHKLHSLSSDIRWNKIPRKSSIENEEGELRDEIMSDAIKK